MYIKKLCAVFLVVCFAFCFIACSDDEPSKSKDDTVKNNFSKLTFSVTDQDNNPVEGVFLRLQKDSTKVTARTNKKGIATFPIMALDGYRVSVMQCPDGYEYLGEPFIHIRQGVNEYKIELTKK